MRHLIFAIFSFLVFTEVASADCYEKFTQGFSKDSHAYQVYGEDLSEDYESLNLEISLAAVHFVAKKIGCSDDEMTISNKGLSLAACRRIHPKAYLSLSCFIEANVGYFMVSEDMMGNLNIVFNRYD
jgi:hypothetical protein